MCRIAGSVPERESSRDSGNSSQITPKIALIERIDQGHRFKKIVTYFGVSNGFQRTRTFFARLTSRSKSMSSNRIGHWFLIEALGLLGGEEVQTSVKFVKLPSPHPGSFSKLPCLSQWERVAE